MLLTLLESTATTAKQPSGLFWVIYIVILVGFMWLLIIRPQKKQKKQMEDLHKAMEPGDNIMTTGGFYGTILDIVDDTTVIVEFGNNKNCRIPMHKNAIAEIEKAGSAVVKDEDNLALSISYSAQTALLPLSVRFTTSLRSICSFSSVTWEMIPTMRLSPASSASTSIACCLDCASREPNPSSINIISGWIAPALRSTISDNPSAIASAARKDSPPDSVFTSRSLSVTRL